MSKLTYFVVSSSIQAIFKDLTVFQGVRIPGPCEPCKHTIQYNKNVTGTASLVEAVSTIQKECKSTGHYKIQFVSCSCADAC